jgi:phage baseplate assembly protein W
MPSSLKISNFSALVGNRLWNLDGNFQFNFDVPAGTVGEVLQNIYNTMQTRYGTQRLQRTFGLEMDFIDMPGNFATLQAQVAVLNAISYWEPRAKFNVIRFSLDPVTIVAGVYSFYCELTINLDVQINAALYAPTGPSPTWVIDGPLDGTPNAAAPVLQTLTV